MRSPTPLPLLASTVAAESSATIINFLYYQPTLTLLHADATATTYKNSCPNGAYGITALSESLQPTSPTGALQPRNPSITTAPLLPRAISLVSRLQGSITQDKHTLCEYYLISQGASTWGLTMQDALPGVWTMSAECWWTGNMMSADMTCTESNRGWYAESLGMAGVNSMTLYRGYLETAGVFHGVAVVKESVAGMEFGSIGPKESVTSSVAAVASAMKSSGGVAVGPLSTGAVAFVGGAVRILAAALAL
ncbi:hypothetical protein T440DRAFT_557081 [Plenodomus tracheiphilus IPT5]|uniref:Uncharacterized protein n=1 Tax=Plenodomus tracheiphilus IPT5 TaxID=1408161 RepID=A0A6A7AX27_9PLEO|nr:hypothetical protein T440DRAFT_557081 [Plenodomus tracheiphilus IPT5]